MTPKCLSLSLSLSLSERNKTQQFLTVVEALRKNPRRHKYVTSIPYPKLYFIFIGMIYSTLLLSLPLEQLTL